MKVPFTTIVLSVFLFSGFAFGQTKVDPASQVKLTDSLGIGAPCPSGTPAGSLCVSNNIVLRSSATSRWGMMPGAAPTQAEDSQDAPGGFFPATFWVRDIDGSPCITVWSSKTTGTPYCSPGKRTIASAMFDGRGSILTSTGDYCVPITAGSTISKVSLLADTNGSANVDLRTVSVTAYAGPSSATSITASAMPQLIGQAKYTDTVLSGWNTAVPANTVMCFHLTDPTGITWLMVSVEGR